MDEILINLTGKNLRVVNGDGLDIEIIPSDKRYQRPFVPVDYETVGHIGKIEICCAKKGEVINLPPKEVGVLYIVSKLVAEVSQRDDFLVPDRMLKNNDGGVIACRCFSKVV